MRIEFLAVNYHSEPDALRLAEDLLAQEGSPDVGLTIVDNTAHLHPAPALTALAARELRVRYLVPGENLGYFGAAAWGRKQILPHGDPDWLVVTNTDIRITDRTFCARLAAIPEVNVLAPAVISGLSGRDQNPYMTRRPSARRMWMYRWVFAWYWGLVAYDLASRTKKWLQRGRAATPVPSGPIYAGHGAFIPFHRSYFTAGGGLEHGSFLFNEEVMVAETARRLGLTIRYAPELQVHHAEHAMTSFLSSRIVAGHMARSARYTAETWFGGAA